jgi:methyltransferase (TIGR00027 family)
MARTDDDSCDITEGVGAAAFGAVWARAQEASSGCPLFIDSYAQRFVDAAIARGWQLPSHPADQAISDYAASRTKWFDDFVITASANGVVQAVILAAGLDARAWRLPWATDSVVYEVDHPRVLAFKAETLIDDHPAARYVPVPIDLRQDWPRALREAGFDPQEPTAWATEGPLPDLPAGDRDLLFERIHELSAPGSRVGVEAFDADVADWLMAQGWRVWSEDAEALMERYGRPPTGATKDTAPRTTLFEGVRG